jgi:hypothetical protein
MIRRKVTVRCMPNPMWQAVCSRHKSTRSKQETHGSQVSWCNDGPRGRYIRSVVGTVHAIERSLSPLSSYNAAIPIPYVRHPHVRNHRAGTNGSKWYHHAGEETRLHRSHQLALGRLPALPRIGEEAKELGDQCGSHETVCLAQRRGNLVHGLTRHTAVFPLSSLVR